MATFTKFQGFVENLAEKVHNLGSDTLKIALCASAPAADLTTANTTLANITPISYANVVSDPADLTLTISASAQTGGTYKLTLADMTITATGGAIAAFRYVVIYNDTAANDNLIGFYDYGSSLTLATGDSLTIDFDAANGVLTIA